MEPARAPAVSRGHSTQSEAQGGRDMSASQMGWLFVATAAVVAACGYVLRPYLRPMVFAFMVSVFLNPVQTSMVGFVAAVRRDYRRATTRAGMAPLVAVCVVAWRYLVAQFMDLLAALTEAMFDHMYLALRAVRAKARRAGVWPDVAELFLPPPRTTGVVQVRSLRLLLAATVLWALHWPALAWVEQALSSALSTLGSTMLRFLSWGVWTLVVEAALCGAAVLAHFKLPPDKRRGAAPVAPKSKWPTPRVLVASLPLVPPTLMVVAWLLSFEVSLMLLAVGWFLFSVDAVSEVWLDMSSVSWPSIAKMALCLVAVESVGATVFTALAVVLVLVPCVIRVTWQVVLMLPWCTRCTRTRAASAPPPRARPRLRLNSNAGSRRSHSHHAHSHNSGTQHDYGGAIAAVIIVTIAVLTLTLPLLLSARVLTDVTRLGAHSVDQLVTHPVWSSDSDWWPWLQATVPWGWFGMNDTDVDLKDTALQHIQAGRQWVAANGEEAVFRMVDDVVPGTLNSTEVKTLLAPVVAYFTQAATPANPGDASGADSGGALQQLAAWGQHAVFEVNLSAMGAKLASLWPVLRDGAGVIFQVNKSVALSVFTTMGQTVAAVTKAFLGVVVFLGALWHLLGQSQHQHRALLPVARMLSVRRPADHVVVAEDMANAISGTLHLTFKTAALHLVFTWLMYDLFAVSGGLGACLWAVAAAAVALLGLAPAALLSLPGALQLWVSGSPVAGIWFFALHWFFMGRMGMLLFNEVQWRQHHVDDEVLAGTEAAAGNQFHSSPFVIGLAVYGGWHGMGSIEGVILGPLAVSVLMIVVHLFEESMGPGADSDSDAESDDDDGLFDDVHADDDDGDDTDDDDNDNAHGAGAAPGPFTAPASNGGAGGGVRDGAVAGNGAGAGVGAGAAALTATHASRRGSGGTARACTPDNPGVAATPSPNEALAIEPTPRHRVAASTGVRRRRSARLALAGPT